MRECTKQILAQVMFKRASGSTLTLAAFNEVMKKLANVDKKATVIEADLMSAPLCRVEYNSVTRALVTVSRWS